MSRFIFWKSQFSNGRPKASAFIPPPNLKTSAFWIDGLEDRAIWDLGDNEAGRGRGKRPRGRADLKSNDVAEVGLACVSDPSPHPRHLNICGWPNEKDEQKAVALELCSRATLHTRELEEIA